MLRRLQWFAIAGAVALTALLYRSSLTGPLVLDSSKLIEIQQHLRDGMSCFDLPRFSGVSGRTLSLLSLCADMAWASDTPVLAMRITNVVLHLLNGVLVFLFVSQFVSRCGVGQAGWIAVAVSALWLLAPIHASTVPYVIQRMTILSATFSLTSLLTFMLAMDARTLLHQGAFSLLSLLLVLCAFLCKETGILAPLLMLLIWSAIRSRQSSGQRLVTARMALLLVVAAGAAAIVSLQFSLVGSLLEYGDRTFSMQDRLLTQPRALWFYISEIVLPHNDDIGLLQDDFVVSHSLFDPVSTGPAIVMLVLAAIGCLRAPAMLAFGFLFFLTGHLLESTVFPLELVFLHRNYLPSVGIILGLTLALYIRPNADQRFALVIVLIVLAWFSTVTAWRAAGWSTEATFFANAYHHHPASRRAASGFAEVLSQSGKHDEALEVLQQAAVLTPAQSIPLSLQQAYVLCLRDATVPRSLMDSWRDADQKGESQEINQGIDNLLMLIRNGKCSGLDMNQFRAAMARLFARRGAGKSWDLQYYTAGTYFSSGELNEGISYLNDVMKSGEVRAGYYLFDLMLQHNRPDEARAIVNQIATQFGSEIDANVLDEMRARITNLQPEAGRAATRD